VTGLASKMEPFSDGPVRGFLHPAQSPSGAALALTHGAGSNCQAPLLVAVANEFAAAGVTVLRFDLPFRQSRPAGPPRPGDAALDREGIRAAAAALRTIAGESVFLGGHSYGGRQSTMLAAAEPAAADGLLLLSYPLHPPRKPAQLRTAHFPELSNRAIFVHGSRDPFGTLEEMRSALALIPAPTQLVEVEGAGHDLKRAGIAAVVLEHFRAFLFPRYNSDNRP
jgi:predicted alpha/beta-hydrolase family hydrolase